MGLVYILTNEAFKENWIKIGITTNLKDRLRDLNKPTGVPLKFKPYATLETELFDKVESLLHLMLDSKRVNKSREFFEIPAEEAYAYFQKLQEILPNSTLHKYGNASSNSTTSDNYLNGYDIPIGATLKHKTGETAVVVSKDMLKYGDDPNFYTLTGLSDKLNGNHNGHPERNWYYKDKRIDKCKKR